MITKTEMTNKLMFVLGLALALAVAGIMFQGSLFGERTVSVAIVLGIVGVCLLAGSKKHRRAGASHGR